MGNSHISVDFNFTVCNTSTQAEEEFASVASRWGP